MTTEKNELIGRILENYVLGRISRKQMDAMIEAVKRPKGCVEKKNDLKHIVYMRVGNENQLR